MTDFGFEVLKTPRGELVYETTIVDPLLPLGKDMKPVLRTAGADWSVSIPHADFPIISLPSKAEAVREMKEFILQAQEALARLEAL